LDFVLLHDGNQATLTVNVVNIVNVIRAKAGETGTGIIL